MSNSTGSITPLIGRVLVSTLFLWSALGKMMAYSMVMAFAQSKGLPLANISVAAAGVLELIGGLAILFGFQTRLFAWLLFAYLIPTTLIFHNFWATTDVAQRLDLQSHFLKNAAIMGGLVSYPMAAAGALLVGVLEALGSFWASAYREVIVFTLLIPVLVWLSLRAGRSEDRA